MSLKLITTPDTLKLHPTSYERGIMIDCFDKLAPVDMERKNYLSDAVVKKMRDFVESHYIVFYFVDSTPILSKTTMTAMATILIRTLKLTPILFLWKKWLLN